MANLGYGYGSAWHLLRYLGYHRGALNAAILNSTGGSIVSWLDFPFNCRKPMLDDEWRGLDFPGIDESVRTAWREFWPTSGNVQNWDAVARLDGTEWILVEAKAHIGELISHCGASEHGGLPKIREALVATKSAMGISPAHEWLSPFYQYANRLAALGFLLTHGIPARLVCIYFTGDTNAFGKCPRSEAGWRQEIRRVHEHLGLNGQSRLEHQVHHVFLPTCE
jgi:hypothetical protein